MKTKETVSARWRVFVQCGLLFWVGALAPQPISRAAPQGPSAGQVVSQFYPPALLTDEIVDQNSCFVVYDSFSDGSPRTIIAGYTNGALGDIRVIQSSDEVSFAVVSEPTDLELSGTNCTVALIDVDGDGKNEIMTSFASARGNSVDWIFRWDGSQLTSLTPTITGPDNMKTSLFLNTAFFDLYHNGTLQVFSNGVYPPFADDSLPQPPDAVYTLTASGYTLDKAVLIVSEFDRDISAPSPQELSFSLPTTSKGPYVFRVTNGNKDGSNRVSSATILLNGVQVVGPNQLSQQVEFLSVPVTLQPQNVIQATLAAKPTGKILFTVEDTSSTNGGQP